jgi:hypothetical protein
MIAVLPSLMDDTPEQRARSLIATYGADEALGFAERGARNVQIVGMMAKVDEWNRVIDAIKKVLGNEPPPS